MQPAVLIIDDEEKFSKLLSRVIEGAGYQTYLAHSAKTALRYLDTEIIYVVIIDTGLPDANGIEFINRVKEIHPYTEAISLTGHGTVKDGISSIRNGAFEYLIKGDDIDKVIPVLSKAYAKADMQYQLESTKKASGFKHILGNSPAIMQARQLAAKVAITDTTVLLLGETGTGKEVFAKAIHNESKRRAKPFLAINCSSFTEQLLESELFGHVAGAFTGANKDKKGLFEAADGGTIFLDEIGEMDLKLQAKLLRVLESGSFNRVGDEQATHVDTRIIAATNRDLKTEAANGEFRWDLFYRLAVFTIQLPSLRERKEDIKQLANYFISEYSHSYKKDINGADDAFYTLLTQYEWKGNIRELKNVISRVMILANSKTLTSDLLPAEFFKNTSPDMNQLLDLAQIEEQAINKALQKSKGNKSNAARLLGIGLSTLYRKIAEYKIKEH
jgi:two-component system, NtrC family, response regulator